MILPDLQVGTEFRFNGAKSRAPYYKVAARNEDYIVAIVHRFGKLWYTIITYSGYTHNGVGPGLILTTLNTLGGGYDVGRHGERAHEVIEALESGEWEQSHRRREAFESYEVRK